MHTDTHARRRMHAEVFTQRHIHTFTHAYTRTDTHIHTHTHTHTHTQTYRQTHYSKGSPDDVEHSSHHMQCMNDAHTLLMQLSSLVDFYDRRKLAAHQIWLSLIK